MNALLVHFRVDHMAGFVGVFVCLFALLTILYSAGSMRRAAGETLRYYLWVILTLGAALGAVFSNNLLLFIVFWGFLGLLLYLLIGMGKSERASATAKKAFIIIGGTDAFMLLGLAIVWHLAGRPRFSDLNMDAVSIALDRKAAVVAYLCLAAGALAKAGAMPFHTWVPDTAEDAPIPVSAYLPASLDKLLGVYFLARLSLEMFEMNAGMNTLLMALGAVTIVAAVMMALVQHDVRRLLGYHAVSQVGYMVLGIGTGTPVGIAGGLFHMLNNAIYKSCLFFSAGAAIHRSGTADLEKMGGFARTMPITFTAFFIASLAISGVPPLNGFASKWMIYQGLIEFGKGPGGLWIIWLSAAMLGSALTLASFMKLLHAVFLGQAYRGDGSESAKEPREVCAAMWLPPVLLAALCVLFGVFAYRLPLRLCILPSLEGEVQFAGLWQPVAAAGFLIVGLALGAGAYFWARALKPRRVEPFAGGERLEEHPEMRLSGVDFYKTVQEMPLLAPFYRWAEHRAFDIYNIGTKLTFGLSKMLGLFHNGFLPRYLGWCLIGMLALFYVLAR